MNRQVPWATEFHRVPNRIKALQLIRAEGPVSRADIARRLELSRPTASRIMDELMQEGMIECVGKSRPTGGRLGDLYTFHADAGVVLGLELGTRHARAAIATLEGEIVCRTERPLALETRESVLPQLRRLVEQTIAGVPRKPATILSAGVAVPGVVHVTHGSGTTDKHTPGLNDRPLQDEPELLSVNAAAPRAEGLNDRPLQRELERMFGVPVAMDNDVNFAAIGESHSGCAQGYYNVAYLFVGRGIGAGLILNGQLFRGSSEAAGEIGNMVIDRANLYQEFGAHGCLESLSGINRLVTASAARGLPYDTADRVCEQAVAGDPHANEIIQQMNEYLAAALINLVVVIDPEIVILGGDLADLPHADELFVRPIEALLRRQVASAPLLRLSQLQGDAALYGAVHAALGVALTTAGRPGGHAMSGADTLTSTPGNGGYGTRLKV